MWRCKKADVRKEIAGLCRDSGKQRGILKDFQVPSWPPYLVHTVLIYGDNSLPGTGPVWSY